MTVAKLEYIQTEQELTAWSIEHQGQQLPYLIRVAEHYGFCGEIMSESILWFRYMLRTFPDHVQHKEHGIYIAGVHCSAKT